MANPPLKRHLDIKGLAQRATDALWNNEDLHDMAARQAWPGLMALTARITITFPDPQLLIDARVSEADVREVRSIQFHHVMAAWTSSLARIKTRLFLAVTSPNEFSHEIHVTQHTPSNPGPDGAWTEQAIITISFIDERTIHILQDIMGELLSNGAFQQCKEIGLDVTTEGLAGSLTVSGPLFSGTAEAKPVEYWLQLDKLDQALAFFTAPTIAERIAAACKDYGVTCDEAREGSESTKRHNISGIPITIEQASDVIDLVGTLHLLAFYPAIKRQDGTIGKILIDLDDLQGFVSRLGQSGARTVTVAVAERIAITGEQVGLPRPAMRFSGSRGAHIEWKMARDVLDRDPVQGNLALREYIAAVKTADAHLGNTSSTAKNVQDASTASKMIAQAIIVSAMHDLDGDHDLLSPGERERLGIDHDYLAVTLEKDLDQDSFGKIVADTQPSDHRFLSPHLKSGLICRPICDAEGNIIDEFRDFEEMRRNSTIDHVAREVAMFPTHYDEPPGIITKDMLEAACAPERLGAVIATIIEKSTVGACTMSVDDFHFWKNWYARKIDEFLQE
ncbi:MAG TPA: hypothetical protein VKM55_04265 [Candidatus Lokiarchaeia archaeon]|nr:hypothetical protein [Candidatus Lokiarchaeia archaeon]